jgi:hypothetical protein
MSDARRDRLPIVGSIALSLLVLLAFGCAGGHYGSVTTPTNSVTSKDNVASVDIPVSDNIPPTSIFIVPTPPGTIPPGGNFIIGTSYNFGPANISLKHQVTIHIHYNPGDIPTGVSPNTLTIAKDVSNAWTPLSTSTVDTVNHIVSSPVSAFGTYGIVVSSGGGGGSSGGPLNALHQFKTGDLFTYALAPPSGGNITEYDSWKVKSPTVMELTAQPTGGSAVVVDYSFSQTAAGALTVTSSTQTGQSTVNGNLKVPGTFTSGSSISYPEFNSSNWQLPILLPSYASTAASKEVKLTLAGPDTVTIGSQVYPAISATAVEENASLAAINGTLRTVSISPAVGASPSVSGPDGTFTLIGFSHSADQLSINGTWNGAFYATDLKSLKFNISCTWALNPGSTTKFTGTATVSNPSAITSVPAGTYPVTGTVAGGLVTVTPQGALAGFTWTMDLQPNNLSGLELLTGAPYSFISLSLVSSPPG